MTTIAYRDGIMAADTASICGDVFSGFCDKIWRRDDGTLIGGSGDAGWCDAFGKWALEGEQGDLPEIKNNTDGYGRSEGVIIRPGGRIEIFTDSGVCFQRGDYWACGSGMAFALGAMAVGASAEGAVRAAIKHDTGSGGEITVLREAEERPCPA